MEEILSVGFFNPLSFVNINFKVIKLIASMVDQIIEMSIYCQS